MIDWFEEGKTAMTLFMSVVVSNLVARLMFRYGFRLKNYQDSALAVTVIAVAVTAGLSCWTMPTVTSVIFGLVFAFLVSRLPTEKVADENSPDRP